MIIKGFWENKIRGLFFLSGFPIRGLILFPGSSIRGLILFSGFCLVILLTGLPACTGSREPAPGLRVGQRAPDFAVPDLQGRTWSLEKFQGKVVLLRFWTDDCPYCRFEMPVIEKYYRRLRPAGLEVLAVNVKQSPQVVEAFIAQVNVTFPMGLDNDGMTAKRYGVNAIPTNFLIDRKGIIQGKLIGEAFTAEKYLRRFLRNSFPDQLLE
jgi:peroxiredoxin